MNDVFGEMWFTRSQFTGCLQYGNSPESINRLYATRSFFGDAPYTKWKAKLIVDGIEFTAYHHTLYGSIKLALKAYREFYA